MRILRSSLNLAVLGVVCTATLLQSETYMLGPDSQPQDGVPKGSVTNYTLSPGAFYPGTPHHYAVYVPAQYRAATPAPLVVFLDGSSFLNDKVRTPIVLDNLIAKHELPPLIGIFVDPGVLPTVFGQAQNRFERVFEYDSLSDRYSRFLLEELIPAVARKYNLSKDPDSHAISGISTGAVGAFMTAWNRPDQFHRVLSFIGTYVAMKGADTLPAIIRKTEPKPIRIFLQDGRNDHIVPTEPYGTFYAGSWPVNNEVMFQAFESAGYDAKLVMGEDAHNMKQGAAILPDALRWLWRDYPSPILVHEPAAMKQPDWDPRGKVYSIVSANQGWQQIGGIYSAIMNPTSDKDGTVFFAEPTSNRIYKSSPDGVVVVFRQHAGGARALRAGPDGRLYAYEAACRRIVSYSASGDEKILAQNVDVNDIVVTAKSTLYFADAEHGEIGYIDATGKSRIVYEAHDIARPFGLALSPDQAMLIVTDSIARYSWSFQIDRNGSLINGEPFYRLEVPEAGWKSGAEGVMEDSTGQVYFATPAGIQVCEANGRLAAILNPPEHGRISGLTFADTAPNWIYVTEGGKLYRRPVKVASTAVNASMKPPKPPL